MKKIENNEYLKIIIDILLMIVGSYLVSLGTNVFLLPHKMTTGGASGIATILYYLFDIPMGVSIVCINIPLFIIAFFVLALKFNL